MLLGRSYRICIDELNDEGGQQVKGEGLACLQQIKQDAKVDRCACSHSFVVRRPWRYCVTFAHKLVASVPSWDEGGLWVRGKERIGQGCSRTGSLPSIFSDMAE